MIVNENREIDQNGKVLCDLNAVVYALSTGADITYIQLKHSCQDELKKFNENCEKFGLNKKMVQKDIVHDLNHELWNYEPSYDKLNLVDYFHNKCKTQEQIDRVDYELKLYEEFNMTKLLRCMIWLVDYMTENNIFWGVGRGSSVSSYCLYLIGIHMVDSIKYDLDVHEFLKWN